MIDIKAKGTDTGVDVSTKAEGEGLMVLEEATAIVKALYDLTSQNEAMRLMFLTVIGDMTIEWMHEERTKGDESYA